MVDQWRAAFNPLVSHCISEKKKGRKGREGGISEDIIMSKRLMLHVCTGQLSIADLQPKNKAFVIVEKSCVSLFQKSIQDHIHSVF